LVEFLISKGDKDIKQFNMKGNKNNLKDLAYRIILEAEKYIDIN